MSNRTKVASINSSLRAALPDGTITAANASSISDGASAVILASESAVEAHGLKPMAKIVAHARSQRLPAEFTLAPVDAISSCSIKPVGLLMT